MGDGQREREREKNKNFKTLKRMNANEFSVYNLNFL